MQVFFCGPNGDASGGPSASRRYPAPVSTGQCARQAKVDTLFSRVLLAPECYTVKNTTGKRKMQIFPEDFFPQFGEKS